jgi:membrane fusion protein (multidrug efflux system)
MKMKLKKIIGIAVLLTAVILVIIRLSGNKEIAEKKVYKYDKEKPITVSIDTIGSVIHANNKTITGIFEPDKESKISSESQGKIISIRAEVGDVVKKGQTLIQLDYSLLQLQLQAVEIQIEGLEADVKRYTILSEADAIQGVQLEKAILGLKSAKIQKATLLEQINKTTIKSPFNGIVTAKLNEVGGFAAPGVPLMQITDISNLKFTINVPETELSIFTYGENYSITTDITGDFEFEGTVTLTGSKSNMGNLFPVQFTVKNTADYKLKSGMFGKVSIENNNSEKSIQIPTSAIISENNQDKVYLIKNGKAVLQDISIQKSNGNQTIITYGLKPGDILITDGFINLFENANVVIK